MTISELRTLLDQCKPNDNIWFIMNSGCCGDFEELELEEAFVTEMNKDEKTLRFTFISLPGYESCMQAGATRLKGRSS